MRWTLPLALAALPSLGFPQDQAADGFLLQQRPYPGATTTSATATLSSGEILVFDGSTFTLHLADGTFVRELSSFSPPVFPGFVRVDPSEGFAVLAESSNGVLIRVGLDSGSETSLVTLPNSYDAVFEDGDHLLVSAATCGFGCGNEIWRLNLLTRSAALLARVSGPSGPLALDPAGNLYYGTSTYQFPPPPHPSRVLRWEARLLRGPRARSQLGVPLALGESDASVVGDGFDGAAGLAIDPLRGDVFLLENNFATGVNRIVRVLGDADVSPVLVEGRPFFSMGNLELEPGDGRAALLPYQPPSGGILRYTTTDFALTPTIERFELSTLRPSATLSGPGLLGAGPFDLLLADGPPLGFARVLYCSSSLYHPVESVFHSSGLPLFLGLDLPTLQGVPGFLVLDASGSVTRTYQNPGGYEGQFAIQLLLFDSDLRIAGTSSAAFL